MFEYVYTELIGTLLVKNHTQFNQLITLQHASILSAQKSNVYHASMRVTYACFKHIMECLIV